VLSNIRKFLSPSTVSYLKHSLPIRIHSRLKLKRQPFGFFCELTTKCNIRCDFCTRTDFTRKGNKKENFNISDMTDETIERVIEELKKFYEAKIPVYFLPMGLGEPLVYEKLFSTYEKIKRISKDIPITMTTNGLTLNEECCNRILASGVDEVSISLNSRNALEYKQHMGLDKYDTVTENIRNLIRIRDRKNKRLRIFIQYIDYEDNPSSFKEDIREWVKIMSGQDKCYVHPLVNMGGYYKNSSIRVGSSEHYPCFSPLQMIAIRLNGDLYPCCPPFYAGGEKIESLYMGNISSTSPFKIFNDKKSKPEKIVACMRRNDYSQLPTCDNCNTYRLAPNISFKIPLYKRLSGQKWL